MTLQIGRQKIQTLSFLNCISTAMMGAKRASVVKNDSVLLQQSCGVKLSIPLRGAPQWAQIARFGA
jgi:hypothetical protein